MVDMARQAREVDQNYDFFQRTLASYLSENKGKYALLKSRELVGFFSSAGEAFAAGHEKFPDGVFSIQEVTDEPIDLGFFSHAGA
jgi:hypothetical protein